VIVSVQAQCPHWAIHLNGLSSLSIGPVVLGKPTLLVGTFLSDCTVTSGGLAPEFVTNA
jgi:hypothetical protein